MPTYSSHQKRPRYFDRQQLRADDLALEQRFQDSRNGQLSRVLHGWGVACGAFVNNPRGSVVDLSPGFAVTPQGDALAIPAITGLDLLPLIREDCATTGLDCERLITPGGELGPSALFNTRFYLIARPASIAAAPRPGVPEECAAPGQAQQYSRTCEAVAIEVICALPPAHQPSAAVCAELQALFCPGLRTGRQLEQLLRRYLDCPPVLGEGDNFVVLAHFYFSPLDDRQEGVTLDNIGYQSRRILMSTQLLQQYLSCFCGTAPTGTPTPTPTPTPGPTPRPTPGPTFRPTLEPTLFPTIFPTFIPTGLPTAFPTDFPTRFPTGFPTLGPGPRPIDGIVVSPELMLDPGRVGAVFANLDLNEVDPLRGATQPLARLSGLDQTQQAALAAEGISTTLDLALADSEELAERLGMSEVAVAGMKNQALLSMRRNRPLNLSRDQFNVDNALLTPAEVLDAGLGAADGRLLREAGLGSVADIANTDTEILMGALDIPAGAAAHLIHLARERARSL